MCMVLRTSFSKPCHLLFLVGSVPKFSTPISGFVSVVTNEFLSIKCLSGQQGFHTFGSSIITKKLF